MFIQSEKNIRSWIDLKKALKQEFSSYLNSAQLHKMLADRKKGYNESTQEYFLIMKELASRGDVEEEALIQYIIDGLPGDQTDKIVLYGSKNLTDFKSKLKIFETIKSKSTHRSFSKVGQNSQKNTFKAKSETNELSKIEYPKTIDIRCFNCGNKGQSF